MPISTLPARPQTPQGARSNDKIPEPDDHGLGRSRGGLTTKVHALVDSGIHPVVVQLSPGQAGDNPRLVPLLDALADVGHRPAHLLAERPTATPPRGASYAAGVSATPFQNVVTRLNTAKRRARAGADHPRSTLSATSERNTVERGFGRFKQWRGIATRYDKYARTYLGGVLLAAIIILARRS